MFWKWFPSDCRHASHRTKTLFIACQNYAGEIETLWSECFLSECLLVRGLLLGCLSFNMSHKESCIVFDLANVEDGTSYFYCVTRTPSKQCIEFNKNHIVVVKIMSECNISVWFYGLSIKVGPVILVALISHHTSTVTLCSGVSCFNVGNLFYWGFTYPLISNQEWVVTVPCTPSNYQFKKFSLLKVCVVEFVNHSGCSTHTFFMFFYCLEWNLFVRSR
jgi:hypothetical protein